MACGYRIWSEKSQTRIWYIGGISHKVNHRSILKEKQMGKCKASASLSLSGGHNFPYFPEGFLIFPWVFSIFLLILVLRLGGLSSWKWPGHTTFILISKVWFIRSLLRMASSVSKSHVSFTPTLRKILFCIEMKISKYYPLLYILT